MLLEVPSFLLLTGFHSSCLVGRLGTPVQQHMEQNVWMLYVSRLQQYSWISVSIKNISTGQTERRKQTLQSRWSCRKCQGSYSELILHQPQTADIWCHSKKGSGEMDKIWSSQTKMHQLERTSLQLCLIILIILQWAVLPCWQAQPQSIAEWDRQSG